MGDLGPICTECDSHRLLCQPCETAGEDWVAARAARENRNGPPTVEVQGFADGEGQWHVIDPPLEISLEGFDVEQGDINEFVSDWLQNNYFGAGGGGAQDGR